MKIIVNQNKKLRIKHNLHFDEFINKCKAKIEGIIHLMIVEKEHQQNSNNQNKRDQEERIEKKSWNYKN